VSISGERNVVTIADASALRVSGSGHQVDVGGSTDSVSVTGSGHDVDASSDGDDDEG
jgi:hypothetical protein